MATYSKKQSTDLRNHIALGNALDDSTIRCRKCTGSQVHEMTCSICGEVKGLEGFSKAQRRTPDNAVSINPDHNGNKSHRVQQRCLECVDEHLALHPDQVQEWDRDDNDGESGLDSDETSNPYENTVRAAVCPLYQN